MKGEKRRMKGKWRKKSRDNNPSGEFISQRNNK
jgi:hypothetical protein